MGANDSDVVPPTGNANRLRRAFITRMETDSHLSLLVSGLGLCRVARDAAFRFTSADVQTVVVQIVHHTLREK